MFGVFAYQRGQHCYRQVALSRIACHFRGGGEQRPSIAPGSPQCVELIVNPEESIAVPALQLGRCELLEGLDSQTAMWLRIKQRLSLLSHRSSIIGTFGALNQPHARIRLKDSFARDDSLVKPTGRGAILL